MLFFFIISYFFTNNFYSIGQIIINNINNGNNISNIIDIWFIIFKYRKTTLYQSLMLTKNSKYIFYLSLLLTMFFVCFVLTILLLLIIQLLSMFGLILEYFREYDNPDVDYIWYSKWSINFYFSLIYFQILNVLIMFSFSFLIIGFTKNIKTYNIILLISMIWLILFCGALNNYFSILPVFSTTDGKVIKF